MAKNSPDEGKNIKMVEKQAAEASMINLKEYRAKRQFYIQNLITYKSLERIM